MGLGTFGHYELQDLLGQGGMGMVYRAFDSRRRRQVALKLLPEHLAADAALLERFRREAFAAARLSDPHVVPIHDFGEIDGRLFIDMALIGGRNLAEILADVGRLEPARAVHILRQAAQGLHTAHEHGLVHRDVKPSNLIVLEHREDFTYLLDFGIAHVVGGASVGVSLTSTGSTVGTLAYMAPERFDGKTRIDARVDVYALTCVLFEMLTGGRPYPSDDVPVLLAAHLNIAPPSVREQRPELPDGWDAVIARGMAKNPDDRFPTATDLADAARQLLPGPAAWPVASAGSATEPVGPPGPVRPPGGPDGQPVERRPGPRSGGSDPGVPGGRPGGTMDWAAAGRPPSWTPVGGPVRRSPADPPTTPTGPRIPARNMPPTLLRPADDRPRRRRRTILLLAGALAVVALLVVAVVVIAPGWLTPGTGTPQIPEPDQLALEAASDPGPAPFTPDLRRLKGDPANPGLLPVSVTDGSPMVSGAADGLYRSTIGKGDCDTSVLRNFLTQRPEVYTPWAAPLLADSTLARSDPPADQPGWLSTLTPVLVRADTWVVDHGLVDGAVKSFPAVLQAGTAVLVDGFGVPRVRCAGGSPLTVLPDLAPVRGAERIGPAWPGFDQFDPVVVTAQPPVVEFGLYDVGDTTRFRRPAGTRGDADFVPAPANADLTGSFDLAGPVRTCTLGDCSGSGQFAATVVISECDADRCLARADQWGNQDLPLTLDGDTWRMSGTLTEGYGLACGDVSLETVFRLDVRATEGVVRNTTWSASKLEAAWAVRSGAGGGCLASTGDDLSYDLTGTRIG